MHLGSPLFLQGIHAGPKGGASQASKEARRQLHEVVKDLMGQQHGDPLIDQMKSIYSILAINLAVHKKAIKSFFIMDHVFPSAGLVARHLGPIQGWCLAAPQQCPHHGPLGIARPGRPCQVLCPLCTCLLGQLHLLLDVHSTLLVEQVPLVLFWFSCSSSLLGFLFWILLSFCWGVLCSGVTSWPLKSGT